MFNYQQISEGPRAQYRTSPHVNKSSSDCQYDAENSVLYSHTVCVRTEYYRGFEFCLKGERSMSPWCSSRAAKASKKGTQRSPTSSKEGIQHRLISQGRKTLLKEKQKPKVLIVDSDEEEGPDITDIIDGSCNEESVADEDGGEVVVLAINGLDESDEDLDSDCSIASGPSLQPKQSRGLCSPCRMLFQREKAPIKDKLLDNDPKSLTCDQWVLLKKWRPSRLRAARKSLSHLQLVKEVSMKRERSSACSRPHIFLQRNLRQCVGELSEKRRNRKTRKRKRKGSHVAKERCLHSNSRRKRKSINCVEDRPNSCSSSWTGFVDCSNEEISNQADVDLTPKEILSSPEPRDIQVQKKAGVFRELLAKMRRNTNMIVKEAL